MWVMVLGGLMALPVIHQEEFPNVETDALRITVPYLGAAPAEVESAVCVRVEEAIEGTQGVKRVVASAMEGMCSVIVELVDGVDKAQVLNDIKGKVDGIDSFPGETEKPIVSEISFIASVMQIAIAGKADERTLHVLGQEIRDEIVALPGVSQAALNFARPYEISVEVSEQTLRRYNLTLAEVAEAIRKGSKDIPGGLLKTEGGEILLRTMGQVYHGREFEDIVVMTRQDGTNVLLGDVALVVDGFKDTDLRAHFDDNPAVVVQVSRVGNEDILAIADQVKSYVDVKQSSLPDGIALTIWKDDAQDLIDRLDALLKNARSGLILVLIVLALFLRFRLALWVAAGLPITLLATVLAFPLFDISISTISIIACILVLGILVDDAIVVGERIYAHEQAGKDRVTAAIEGTTEVSIPVIFGVLTSMATFIPIINIPGDMAGFFVDLGYVVLIALFFSIIESQLILPAHLAYRTEDSKRGRRENVLTRMQDRLSVWMDNIAQDSYRALLRRVLEWRYLAVSIALSILLLCGVLMAAGHVVFQFMPSQPGERMYASLTLPEGTPIEVTEAAAYKLEVAAESVRALLDAEISSDGDSVVRHVMASVGSHIQKNSINFGGTAASNIAEVAVELDLPDGYSDRTPEEIVDLWRGVTEPITDAVELSYTAEAFSIGDPIDVELRGYDFASLKRAAAEVRTGLQQYPGVLDVTDSFRAGKQELRLSLLPEARNLGLTLEDLGQQVRQAFYGYEAQRIQRGKDDIRVMVRFPENERRSLGDLENMRIRTSEGVEVPFGTVARTSLERGQTTITREGGQRVVHVISDVNRQVNTPEKILRSMERDVFPGILEKYSDVSIKLGGEAEESMAAMGGLVRLSLLAMLVIYALLAIPLKSYLQPLVIMSVIPFGAVGAIIGHFLLGFDLVFFSVLGIVALSGVVVNSSLVLVDNINRRRETGEDLIAVLCASGAARFRPIVLTSATTFVGLVPLIALSDLSTKMFVPMATSLASGVVVATFITLFLVPCIYLILDELRVPPKSR